MIGLCVGGKRLEEVGVAGRDFLGIQQGLADPSDFIGSKWLRNGIALESNPYETIACPRDGAWYSIGNDERSAPCRDSVFFSDLGITQGVSFFARQWHSSFLFEIEAASGEEPVDDGRGGL
jgi:hypothetical protein